MNKQLEVYRECIEIDFAEAELRVASWYTSKGNIRKQTKHWTMKDGTKIRICDMDDGHLANTIALLERVAKILFMQECKAASVLSMFFQGELAKDSIDDFFNAVDEGYITEEDYLPDIYHHLTIEKERRKDMEKKFFIAGVQHHPGMKAVIKDLEIGTVLELIPDPENKFDPNAIRIEHESNMLGYVPKKFSAEVSAILEIEDLECVIEFLDPSAKPWEQCMVTIRPIDNEQDEEV